MFQDKLDKVNGVFTVSINDHIFQTQRLGTFLDIRCIKGNPRITGHVFNGCWTV